MKTKVVLSSEVGTGCWSAARFTGGCFDCPRVEKCKLPEAVMGRALAASREVEQAETAVRDAEEKLQQAKVKRQAALDAVNE